MTISNPPATPPSWQDALDPQLLQRLLSRALQPGVSRTQLAAAIMARIQSMVPSLSLLAEITQRYGEETVQAGHVPIVYAMPPQDHEEQGDAVSAYEPRSPQWNITVSSPYSSNTVADTQQPLVVQAKTAPLSPISIEGSRLEVVQRVSDSAPSFEKGGDQASQNVSQSQIMHLRDGNTAEPVQESRNVERRMVAAGPVATPLVIVQPMRTGGQSYSRGRFLTERRAEASFPRKRESSNAALAGIERLDASLRGHDGPEKPTPVRGQSFPNVSPMVAADRQAPISGADAVTTPRPVVRPTRRLRRDNSDSASHGPWPHLGFAEPVRQEQYVNAKVPTNVDRASDARPPVTNRPVVTETRRPSPQVPLSLTVTTPIGQPNGSHPHAANRLDTHATRLDMPPRVPVNDMAVGQRQHSSFPSTPQDTVASLPPVMNARNGLANGLDLNALVEKVQSGIDIGKLSERVQKQLRRRLMVERERRGGW